MANRTIDRRRARTLWRSVFAAGLLCWMASSAAATSPETTDDRAAGRDDVQFAFTANSVHTEDLAVSFELEPGCFDLFNGRCECDSSCCCPTKCCPTPCEICCPTPTSVEVKKHCWNTLCEKVCIPGIRFPWDCCCRNKCGRVRSIRVLEKHEYKDTACGCEWEVRTVCPSGCCSAGDCGAECCCGERCDCGADVDAAYPTTAR